MFQSFLFVFFVFDDVCTIGQIFLKGLSVFACSHPSLKINQSHHTSLTSNPILLLPPYITIGVDNEQYLVLARYSAWSSAQEIKESFSLSPISAYHMLYTQEWLPCSHSTICGVILRWLSFEHFVTPLWRTSEAVLEWPLGSWSPP